MTLSIAQCPIEFATLDQICECQDRNTIICPNPSVNPRHEVILNSYPNYVWFGCRSKAKIDNYISEISLNDVIQSIIFDDCDLPNESYTQWLSSMNVTISKLVLNNLPAKPLNPKLFENLKIQRLVLQGIKSENIQNEELFMYLSRLTHLKISGKQSQNIELPSNLFNGLTLLEFLSIRIPTGELFLHIHKV